MLVDEEAIFAFYDALVPEGIVNGAGFETWREEAERANPQLLSPDPRVPDAPRAPPASRRRSFPSASRPAGAQLKLAYRFEPGHPLDGVTATVPLHLLNQLEAGARSTGWCRA